MGKSKANLRSVPDAELQAILGGISETLAEVSELLRDLISIKTRGPGRPRIEHPMRKCGWEKCPKPGGMFEPSRRDQVYCSIDCKMEGFRAKKARKEIRSLARQAGMNPDDFYPSDRPTPAPVAPDPDGVIPFNQAEQDLFNERVGVIGFDKAMAEATGMQQLRLADEADSRPR